ncbi:hypothetical protein CD58_23770 [Pseudomonas brassicacearum]|nr:hypothetical protein CD58_23770 [Pseudomonas brassicacearum]
MGDIRSSRDDVEASAAVVVFYQDVGAVVTGGKGFGPLHALQLLGGNPYMLKIASHVREQLYQVSLNNFRMVARRPGPLGDQVAALLYVRLDQISDQVGQRRFILHPAQAGKIHALAFENSYIGCPDERYVFLGQMTQKCI